MNIHEGTSVLWGHYYDLLLIIYYYYGLPSSVTSVNTFPSFKKALKTHLFQLANDT